MERKDDGLKDSKQSNSQVPFKSNANKDYVTSFGKYNSDEDDFISSSSSDNNNKWKLELACLTKALEPALQLCKWALPAGLFNQFCFFIY